MNEIAISKGFIVVVDDIDIDLANLVWYRATPQGHSYAMRHIYIEGRRSVESMHRVILARMLKRPLTKSDIVDHVDGNGMNNQRGNLRLASHADNMRNRKRQKNNTSGYKGVYFNRVCKVWCAAIRCEGETKYLGWRTTPEAAYELWKEAAMRLFGEFYRAE